VLPGSPLFQFAPPASKHATAKHVARNATTHDHEFVTTLLTSIPRHLGGAAEKDIQQHTRSKQVWVLEHDGRPAAAAIVVPQGDSYAWVDSFVLEPSARHIDSGHKLFEKLAVEIAGQGRRLIFGMSHQGTSEYIGAIKLGSTIVRQSYHGFLAGACQDFKYSPTYT
jgi:N-acetylglutamate synthase-like GNAT family acetyltransferase